MANTIFAVLTALVLSFHSMHARAETVQVATNVYHAGIDETRFQFLSAPQTLGRQQQSNWCWAASAKMVLNYYGIPITQTQIVSYVFGLPVDQPGGSKEILRALNNGFSTITGERVQVRAALLDPTKSAEWVPFLENGQPLIVGLAGAATNVPGHAYVLKSIVFSRVPGGVIVHSLTLADPWPTSPVETTLGWDEFMRRQLGLYIVH